MSEKTYVITGGAGFIGSHIVEELVKDPDARIVVVDNLLTGRVENLRPFGERVEFHQTDIRDYDALARVVHGADYVFHEAALVSVAISVENPAENHEVNMTGTLNVFRAAKAGGARRVVLASSAAIYGNDPGLPKKEDMLPRPASPYGAAKILKEYYASIYSGLYGLPAVALRYFNVFGPRQDPSSPYSGVISIFANRILSGKPVTLYGDGGQTRDFVFVKDVVRANLLAMHDESLRGGEVFNVGTGEATDLLKLLRTMSEIVGKRIVPQYAEARSGDIRRSESDISFIKDRLGYVPQFSLEQGLRQLFASLKSP